MISIEQLTFGYKSPLLKKALNFKVDSPAVISILGNNGSGKSTFFNVLREKLKYSGAVLLDDKPLETFSLNPFVFLGQSYSFGLDIDVETFLNINVRKNHLNKQVFQFLFKSLKIEELKSQSITTLSQGQLQRCLVMQTLIQDSDFFLLDEPESFLDLHFRNVLGETLKEFSARFNKTILLATHDLDLVFSSSAYLINFSSTEMFLQAVTKTIIEENRTILLK